MKKKQQAKAKQKQSKQQAAGDDSDVIVPIRNDDVAAFERVSAKYLEKGEKGFIQTIGLAIRYNAEHVCTHLLGLGFSPNACDTTGQTPLMKAAVLDHFSIMARLIMEGATVDAVDNKGHTALHLATCAGKMEAVTLLIGNGANVNATGKPGMFIEGVLSHHQAVDIVNYFLVDANVGFTPLHIATFNSSTAFVNLLLDSGANVVTGPFNLLHLASICGVKVIVDLILARNCLPIDARDSSGRTALHLAATLCQKDVVEMLLACGADVNAIDDGGATPLHSLISTSKGASNRSYDDVHLDEEKPRCRAIISEANKRLIDVIGVLVACGATVNAVDKKLQTPLIIASSNGRKDVVVALIAKGGDVNFKCDGGTSALVVAATNGNKDIVGALIANGAKVNMSDSRGWSPLYAAATQGHADVAQLLLSSGAKVDSPDKYGWTPLQTAAMNKHADVVNLLLMHGANIDSAENVDNVTALYAAAANEHIEVVKLLISAGATVPTTSPQFMDSIIKLLEQTTPDGQKQRLKDFEAKMSFGIRRNRVIQRVESVEKLSTEWLSSTGWGLAGVGTSVNKAMVISDRCMGYSVQLAEVERAVLIDPTSANIEHRDKERARLLKLLDTELPKALEALKVFEDYFATVKHLHNVDHPVVNCAPSSVPADPKAIRELLSEWTSVQNKCTSAFLEMERSHRQSLAVMTDKSPFKADWEAIDASNKARTAASVEVQTLFGRVDELSWSILLAIESDRLSKQSELSRHISVLSEDTSECYTQIVSLQRARDQLQRTLALGLVKDERTKSVSDARDALDEARDNAEIARLKAKRGGEQAVAELRLAEQVLISMRQRYHNSVRELLEVIDAGYPELKCVATSSSQRELLPNVPIFSASELQSLDTVSDETKISSDGGLADVHRLEMPGVGFVAFKRFRTETPSLSIEANALWSLRHPNIVSLLKVCTDPGMCGLVLEYMEGGSLGKRIHESKEPRLKRNQILVLLRDVLKGVAYVHEKGQLHLDIKSDNILLNADCTVAKLADFGCAKEARETLRATRLDMTPRWCAPEVFQQLPHLTAAADVWSVSMVLYEMCVARLPYHDVDMVKLVHAIGAGAKPTLPSDVDKFFASLFKVCWNFDVSKRPSAASLLNDVEGAMMRACGVCGASLSIGKGITCTGSGHHFRCWNCHANSNCDEALVNGDVRCKLCNDGGIFEFASIRSHLTASQYVRWNTAMLAAQRSVLNAFHLAEIERLRNQSEVDRLVENILLRLLFDACPRCHSRFEYTEGCMALVCPVCKCNFCGHCFKDCGDDAHKHATNCEYNKNKGNVFLVGDDEKKSFETVSFERRKRELRLYLQSIGDVELRGRVEQLLRNDKDRTVADAFAKLMLPD
jgi:ankyrin repeat protein/serine/threonine protein kinase